MMTETDRAIGHILAVEINDFLPSGKSSPQNRSRVIPNILHLLDHVDKHRAEGNFFITPDLISDFPEIVSLVSSRGHEIGLCLDNQKLERPDEIKAYKEELQKITGDEQVGAMVKADFDNRRDYLKKVASCSFYYSLLNFNPAPKEITSDLRKIEFNSGEKIIVFPPSTYNFWGIKIGFGNAGKIRLYPYWFLRRCLRHYANYKIPGVMNFPLWEFDSHMPRMALSPLQSLKSYGNLTLAEFKLSRLLLEFDFVRITRLLNLNNEEK